MQDLDKFKNEMNLSGKNVYVGHRYVPKIFGEWDKSKLYEPLSIVQYQGASYTSRQYVPVGVEITNEEFWVVTGNYDAQVEHYRQHVVNLGNDVNNFNDEVDTLSDRVDKEYQNVTTRLAKTEKQFITSLEDEQVSLGNELVKSGNWLTNGWTGDYNNGFTHTVGEVIPLEVPVQIEIGKKYQIAVTIQDDDERSGFNFNVSLGNSYEAEMYKGGTGTQTYEIGVTTLDLSNLKIKPKSEFTGTVLDISVREIRGTIKPTQTITDSAGLPVLETRTTGRLQDNLYLGKSVGQGNSTGYHNTVIGQGAFVDNTTGFWNTGLGRYVLANNETGSRNNAIGYNALLDVISGHRNQAFGTFALRRVTTGSNNIGIGADAAWNTTTGYNNIAIGTVSLDKNTTGRGNIAIGYNALRDNVNTSYNIAIGEWALRNSTAHNNTAVGTRALEQNTSATGQTAVGYESLANALEKNNTAVGQWAGSSLVNGEGNIFIGRRAGSGLVNGRNNIIIGTDVLVDESMHNTLNIGNIIHGGLLSYRIGLGGVPDPQARLHLRGGTAGTPALMLETGVLTSELKPGAFEYDGTNLYFTVSGERVNLTNR